MLEREKLSNVLRLVVLEFNVQAILNTDLHLDRVIAIWRHAVRMYPKVLLLDHFRHPSGNRDTYKVPIPIKQVGMKKFALKDPPPSH